MAPDIERIPAPAPEMFREEYLLKRKPVILTGLFDGQEITKFKTVEAARAQFGHLPLSVQDEYVTGVTKAASAVGAEPEQPQTMTLNDYLDFVHANPGTRKMCSERPTPPEVLSLFALPPYDGYEDAISSYFIGNQGNFAHLHFDGDYRHVFFYQVFGTKRIILIPPSQALKLNAVGNQGGWNLENFSEEDKRDFVRFVRGYDCILEAGEVLFMPACIWHYLEYTTTSMSFNLRFGRNEYTRFFANSFHMNVYLQNIAEMMVNTEVARRDYAQVFAQLRGAYSASYASSEERYRELQKAFERIYHQYCSQSIQSPYALAEPEVLRQIYRKGAERLYQSGVDAQALVHGWTSVAASFTDGQTGAK